jgi:hypothetical protein
VLKFFSKNKKGTSEIRTVYENVGQESPAIRKLVKPIHAKAILADGRLYDTQTATYVCEYGDLSLFVTKNGRWFGAKSKSELAGYSADENGDRTAEYRVMYYGLECVDKFFVMQHLWYLSGDLYKKYFGEVEEG